ncbi:hypothetical protein B0H14DRAFT_2582884 [Mycena olivaceomarginata]|nr:hypothetical protein B0H14DRAFT_2582884 [Mycena olivaceomarginata]
MEEIFDYDDARLFWRSPVWKVLLDEDTPDTLHMSNRERIYYVAHIVVVHKVSSCDLSMDGQKYTFGIGKTCSLDSLRGQLSHKMAINCLTILISAMEDLCEEWLIGVLGVASCLPSRAQKETYIAINKQYMVNIAKIEEKAANQVRRLSKSPWIQLILELRRPITTFAP